MILNNFELRIVLLLVCSSTFKIYISSKIMSIEQTICDSHNKKILYDETIAVTKIKSDPNFFFKYAKKFNMCTKAIGPLLQHHTHLLTDDKT